MRIALNWRAIAAGAVAFGIMLFSAHGRSTQYNNYVLLANAFLHGRIALVDWPGPATVDALAYHGKMWIIEAPFPALVLLPFVAFLGTAATNQTLLAISFGALAVGAAWVLCERLGVGRGATFWLVLFFFAGTDLWWCSQLGDVWFIAHSAAVCCTLLALVELTGKRRAWVVALLAAAAFESRFTMVMAVPFYAYVLARGGLGDRPLSEFWDVKTARVRSFVLTLLPIVALMVLYNEARWGTIADIGYTAFYHEDSWGQRTGSPFRIDYLPYEIYSFFMRPPDYVDFRQLAQWPIFKVDVNGVALTWTSPALVLAFLAKRRDVVVALWITIVLLALPNFFYYLNGWYQFGMRHALDFEPFMLVLMALAVRHRFPLWGKVLCVYSALAGTWGVWYWNAFYRSGN